MRRGIVTIGYQGRTLDDFTSTLESEGVEVLVDVRLNAISRKRGFSKTALMTAVQSAGIEYVHAPLLGNPINNRDGFRAGHKQARANYRARLENRSSAAVDELIALSKKKVVGVLCVERDHEICHRNELVKVACERAPRLKVIHIS